ncbi:NAD-dependent succinate-semialdehyde dehydrogenase [Cesiribacter andamanensis]|uniref:Succinate-semialdehyde dehydrogenase [NADP(+)] 1 n=1 Tax=Cesiribacter andamanensis AMV16 TaxID=1279009 RepID=M7N4U3_9BACT|nr:NAD-dependent succinate-semialdehyde dehydrogenase [Cesiribacter andamanensis]EMR03683.1 Succinate-semialdehyde dehydrogenase [NADP(+)] 1 [Cesiribacter andamanensis AMV16]
MSIQSVNPFNNEIIRQFHEATDTDIQAALEASEEGFRHWKQVPLQERSSLMMAAAQVMEDDLEHYAHLMTLEMGKTLREARAEIEKCAACCRYYATHAEAFLKDKVLDVSQGKAFISYEPLGPVLAIMPWNFPFWQVIRFAAPNLMAGNVGILKHASSVPQVALALEEIFRKAGFPDGAFLSLLIGNKKTEKLIAHPTIRAVTLTGSERAGSSVAARAGKYIKKTVLELGGSDPFVVLEDADLDKAAEWAVKSRMINMGQSCIAAKRFIVLDKVYDDFINRFRSRMEALKIGDPQDDDMDHGPMAREDLAEGLLEQVQKSLKKGATLVTGGDRPNSNGAFFTPTILADIPKNAPAFKEELFGPVASVIRAMDEAEAIDLANSSVYGLGGSVWSRDLERGQAIARQIQSGAVYVNKMMASDPAVPFGGIKLSGYGRELSYLGMHEFLNQKTIWVQE